MMLVNQQLLQNTTNQPVPQIDFYGYIQSRFDKSSKLSDVMQKLFQTLKLLSVKLEELKEGMYGCGNHGINMELLKGIHKKLKKCRVWVGDERDEKKKKRKKKRKGDTKDENGGKKIKE